MAVNLLWLTPFLYLIQVFDRVLSTRSIDTLLYLSIAALLAYLTFLCASLARSLVLTRASVKLDKEIADDLMRAATLTQSGSADSELRSRSMNDLSTLRDFLTGAGLPNLMDMPWFLLFAAVIAHVHPILGVMAFSGGILLVLFGWLLDVTTRNPLRLSSLSDRRSQRIFEATARNSEAVRAMGMFSALKARWKTHHLEAIFFQVRASARAATVHNLTRFFRLVLQSSMLGVGAWLVIHDNLAPVLMIAGTFLLGRALAPLEQFVGSWRSMENARESYRRLDQILSLLPPDTRSMPLPKPDGYLSVENLAYVPPGRAKPTLANVNFHLEAGETLAIIGPSGAGKSTLLRVIVGHLKARQGVARLDGADLSTWDVDDIGNHVGYLPQEPQLFSGSAAANIARFGDVDSSDVVRAAQAAGVHELILQLPDGYDTEIGEDGNKLSGGQRQRIAFARALLGQPSLVLLDEPNSHLDSDGEFALIRALEHLKRSKVTTILVSHKPSIIAHVDKVMVMKDGLVDQYGSKEDIFRINSRGKGVRVV